MTQLSWQPPVWGIVDLRDRCLLFWFFALKSESSSDLCYFICALICKLSEGQSSLCLNKGQSCLGLCVFHLYRCDSYLLATLVFFAIGVITMDIVHSYKLVNSD